MFRVRSAILTALLALACAAAGGEGELARFLGQFRKGDAEAKQRLIEAGAAAVKPLFALVADKDRRTAEEARSALRWIAIRAARLAAPEGEREKVLAAALPYLDARQPPAARRTAVEMLGLVGSDAGVARLAPLLQDEALASDAIEALGWIATPAARTALHDALNAVEPPLKERIQELLARPREPAAPRTAPRPPAPDTALLAAAATQPDELAAIEAVRALGRQATPAAASALANAAKQGATPGVRALALQATIRVAHRLADQGQLAQASALFQQVYPLATRGRERAEIIRGFGKCGDPKARVLLSPIAGPAAGTHPKHPLRGIAVEALLAIADASTKSRRDDAIAIYKQIVDLELGETLAAEATKKLFALGVPYSLAAKKGYIVSWWMIGPFGCRDMRDAKRPRPPERDLDLTKVHREGSLELRWQLRHTLHPQGLIDCNALFTPNDRVLIYAYTELTAPQPMAVKLWLRRDDGLTLWLNGKVLYNVHTSHGTAVGEYSVDAKLVRGKNRLLVKSSEGGGAWGFSLRMTDPAGKPFGD